MPSVSLTLALSAGVVSFFSPCVLPLLPTYLAYLSGLSFGKESATASRYLVVQNAAAFVAGFSFVFIGLGLSATLLGQLFAAYHALFRKVSALIIILFGLHVARLLPIPFLYREWRTARVSSETSLIRSFLLGIGFSFGWTPCIGPVLASILLIAGNTAQAGQGALLLAVYSLGMAVPFLAVSFFWERITPWFKKVMPSLPIVQIVTGLVLVVFGVLMYFNLLARLSGFVS